MLTQTKIQLAFFILFLLSFQNVFAQSAKTDWTTMDILTTEYARSIQFSPDGQRVLWSKKQMLKEEDKYINKLQLTLLNVREKGAFKTVALTSGDANDYGAIFSPDNSDVYFLSSRENGNSLWRISLYGGEAQRVDSFENGISDLKWLGRDEIAFLSDEGKTRREREFKKKKDNTMVIEDTMHWKATRIFVLNIKTKKMRRLTENKFPIRDYWISPSGEWMITQEILSPAYDIDGQPAPRYILHNLNSEKKEVILNNIQEPGSFKFLENNKGFYFTNTQSSDPHWQGAGVELLWYFDLKTKKVQQVPLQSDWGLHNQSFRIAGKYVIALLADGALNRLAIYEKSASGWEQKKLEIPKMMQAHLKVEAVTEDGKHLIVSHSTASQLPQYYRCQLAEKGDRIQLLDFQKSCTLNEKLKAKTMTRSEVIHWKGWQGDDVTGVLHYPKNYQKDKKYPLLLSIHGGPASATLDRWAERWSTFPQIWAQRGAFVLKPNYHGSDNHGRKFVESIKGNYYTPGLTDIVAGIRDLARRGLVDTSQMGSLGWSNGAILTTMLTVRYPDMFKVACPGAGDVNWTSDYGTCAFGVTFDQSYFIGAPWDDRDGNFYNKNYLELSPLFELEKVKTPTIIFHGSKDRAVPRDQGWEYYRALQQVGKAPVRFLWFPDQPHGLKKISHQVRKMEEEIAWVDRWLFGKKDTINITFNKNSPLSYLLKFKKFKNTGGDFGEKQEKALLPEMLPAYADSIAISRFEITHTQFKCFDKKHPFTPLKANFPASNISFNQAQAYTKWLSKFTGKNYRLPNIKEAKALHKKALEIGGDENTLSYWAGYSLNADEVKTFLEKVGDADLVKSCGEFAPTKIGKAELYDLGGNVAEWAADGSTYGFSAYERVDAASEKEAKPKVMGFRVVLEAKR